MNKLIFLVVLTGWVCHTSAKRNTLPIVKFKDGKIQGREFTMVNDTKKYYGFTEIPYAKPPVGDLRFAEPVKNDKWKGLRTSPRNTSVCRQKSGGSEDCLYINVFTPDASKKNLPVMVWIHGGAFIFGSSSEFSPEYFMKTGAVIVVTLNYRLNIFGFMSTGDHVVPGNMGLKDQLLALKWVQKNIKKFGGNPNKVTIFGQSAGSASVSYQLQSPRSKGLFHRAIMQSGSSLCSWALYRNVKNTFMHLGNQLNLSTSSSESLVRDLRALTADELQAAAATVYNRDTFLSNILDGLLFVPVIEPESETAFFTEKSHQLLLEGRHHRVPTIIGHNSLEANSVNDLKVNVPPILVKYEISENLVPAGMNITNHWSEILVGTKIKLKYFGISFILSINQQLTQFVSDDQFNRPITETGRLLSQYAPTYFYVFSYEGSEFKLLRKGVGHSGELPYLILTNDLSKYDLLIRQRMVTMWTNFAVTGNPTPQNDTTLGNTIWKPMTTDKMSYLVIDKELKMEEYPNNKTMTFYDELFDKFGVPPFDTY